MLDGPYRKEVGWLLEDAWVEIVWSIDTGSSLGGKAKWSELDATEAEVSKEELARWMSWTSFVRKRPATPHRTS